MIYVVLIVVFFSLNDHRHLEFEFSAVLSASFIIYHVQINQMGIILGETIANLRTVVCSLHSVTFSIFLVLLGPPDLKLTMVIISFPIKGLFANLNEMK